MLLVGQTGLAGRETWEYLRQREMTLVTLGEVRRRGMTAALDEALAGPVLPPGGPEVFTPAKNGRRA
jgi:hypothetical protein